MKQYLMLTNEELKRSWKMIVAVILAMASIEILTVVGRVIYQERQVRNYMSDAKVTESEALRSFGKLSFEQASSYFSYVIMIGIVLVILYAIQIWYRDWFGESKYIYRLLLLPGGRAKIFFAKWTSLALVIISFIGLQWAVIQLSYAIFNWLIKNNYRASSFDISMTLKQLYTMNVVDVLILLILSLFVVSFLFMLVLLERSYRKAKGLLFIVLEVIALLVIMMGGMYVIETLDIFLSQEISGIMLAIFVLYFAYTIWKSLRLLKWKISV
ncbi:hypothetical protein BLD48_08200 [Exiguobacterium sp. KRL4]|uniref:hypothetical protein n=1 Tax=Exiguobacterium sp. KRL4 TaxID=1914536 RepID=UPI0008F87762|nr:hypothetical protein [Exiguobacterium sp. KRL4]OIN66927.1 hypothetical protein BLD48_08200 [Exiguobacterium sp. KRL4]